MLAAALGAAAAWAVGRILASQLSEVAPTDPATLAASVAVLCCVALLASDVPARRAASVDPQTARRGE